VSRSRFHAASLWVSCRLHLVNLEFGVDVNSSDHPIPPPSSPQKLQYAPKLPLLRRLRRGRWLTMTAILIVAALSPMWWSRLSRRVEGIYWQHECLVHPIPPGIVVYSGGPPVVSKVSQAWMKLDAIAAPMGAISAGTVYLGERTAHDGTRQLVAVDADVILNPASISPSARVGVEVVARTLKESDLWAAPSETSGRLYAYGGPYGLKLPHMAPVTIVKPEIVVYSATEDQVDPAHFTFFYDIQSERVNMDCWLEDGAVRMDRTVEARPMTTPSTAPAQ
jgi:hypothetical protein